MRSGSQGGNGPSYWTGPDIISKTQRNTGCGGSIKSATCWDFMEGEQPV